MYIPSSTIMRKMQLGNFCFRNLKSKLYWTTKITTTNREQKEAIKTKSLCNDSITLSGFFWFRALNTKEMDCIIKAINAIVLMIIFILPYKVRTHLILYWGSIFIGKDSIFHHTCKTYCPKNGESMWLSEKCGLSPWFPWKNILWSKFYLKSCIFAKQNRSYHESPCRHTR